MTLTELLLELRNTLHASASWQDDRATLASRNLAFLAADLLRTLKSILMLRTLLAVQNQTTNRSCDLCCIVSVMQRSDRIVPRTFKLI